MAPTLVLNVSLFQPRVPEPGDWCGPITEQNEAPAGWEAGFMCLCYSCAWWRERRLGEMNINIARRKSNCPVTADTTIGPSFTVTNDDIGSFDLFVSVCLLNEQASLSIRLTSHSETWWNKRRLKRIRLKLLCTAEASPCAPGSNRWLMMWRWFVARRCPPPPPPPFFLLCWITHSFSVLWLCIRNPCSLFNLFTFD